MQHTSRNAPAAAGGSTARGGGSLTSRLFGGGTARRKASGVPMQGAGPLGGVGEEGSLTKRGGFFGRKASRSADADGAGENGGGTTRRGSRRGSGILGWMTRRG